MKKKKVQLFDVIVFVISLVMVVVVLYPLILVLSNSISKPAYVSTGQVLFFPKGFTLDGYKAVFENKDIMLGYANTIFYTVTGVIATLVVTLPAGYAFTKKELPGNGILMKLFMFTMYFGGGLVPTFLVVNDIGLYNTRAIIILISVFSVYNCIICRSFFAAIPTELEEAAEMDGSGPIRTFFKIVMPLSKALVGVMTLWSMVGHWNAYFDAMIYLKDKDKQPLQLVLRRILILAQQASQGGDDMGDYAMTLLERESLLRYSMIVVSSLPLLIIYPFLQKYFDKGVLIGSVKG